MHKSWKERRISGKERKRKSEQKTERYTSNQSKIFKKGKYN